MANPLLNVPWEPCMVEPRPDGALETYARRKMGVLSLANGLCRLGAVVADHA